MDWTSDSLDMTPKAEAAEENINKLDFMKIENFCPSKDVVSRVKKTYTMGENIHESYICHGINIQST